MRKVKWFRSVALTAGRTLELGVEFEWRGLMRWLPSYPVEKRPALFDLTVHANVTDGGPKPASGVRRRYPSSRDLERLAKGRAMKARSIPTELGALREFQSDLHEALGAMQSLDDLGTNEENRGALQLLTYLEGLDCDVSLMLLQLSQRGAA